MIRKMSGKGKHTSSPLNVNGQIISDTKQKADIFAKNLDDILGQEPPVLDEDQAKTVRDSLQDGDEFSFNTAFNLHELNDSLDALKTGKAMGDDDIENEFLKNLPDHKKIHLFNCYRNLNNVSKTAFYEN